MKKMHLLLAAGSSLAASAGFSGAAHAQAFYLQEQSARGAGRAFSGEVADTGAASLWWNPAAIAGAERIEANLNVAAILPHGDVVDTGTLIRRPGGQPFTPVGGDSTSRHVWVLMSGPAQTRSPIFSLSNQISMPPFVP